MCCVKVKWKLSHNQNFILLQPPTLRQIFPSLSRVNCNMQLPILNLLNKLGLPYKGNSCQAGLWLSFMVGVDFVVEQKEVEWSIALFVINWNSFLKVKEETAKWASSLQIEFHISKIPLSLNIVRTLPQHEKAATFFWHT